jgi:phosphohistidine phosphatase SixA
MELLIIRHGEAASLPMDEAGPSLNDAGQKEVRDLATLLQHQALRPQGLWTSPLRRALETAELLQGLWDLPPQAVDWLKPGVEPSKILKQLASLDAKSPVLVGHLPTLGWLFSTMLWGLPPKEVSLPKASAALLEVKSWEASGAKIKWLLHPQLK